MSDRQTYPPGWPEELGPDMVRQYAATLLEERGWCQRDYVDRQGRMCAMGALITARRYLGAPADTEDLVAAQMAEEIALPDEYPEARDRVSTWNDRRGRTAAEVIAAVRGPGSRTDG